MNSQIAISTFENGSLTFRGIPSDEVATHFSFVEGLILLLTGAAPAPCDPRVNVVTALLNSWLDHGDKPPMTQNVINCASVGASLAQAVTAALATWGVHHCPVEPAAVLFAKLVTCEGDTVSLAHVMGRQSIFPGFGHPVHDRDPRVLPVLELARQLEQTGSHVGAMNFVEATLAAKGKQVFANLGGLTAALWLDMGFPIEAVSLVPLIGRSVGLAAHYTDTRRHGQKFAGTPPKQ